MRRDRSFRVSDESSTFDWQRPARELGVALGVARALYLRATRFADDPRRAEVLYLRWLRDAAEARRPVLPAPVPGRQTRVEHEAQGHRRTRPQDLAAAGVGKWTRSLLETEVDRASAVLDASAVRPGSAGSPSGGLREDEPATSASADAPVLQRVPRTAGGRVARVFGRTSPGAALPAEVAARLAPHVGARAAGAARLHTDDAAALVAEAHQARALTIGADIYFGRGEYQPGTVRGDELLAHELTHVAQGQRGELTRAAAKGITGGTNLDPAEAEADLRARLAVVQLHAPAGAAPPLAEPTGQPASNEERAADLAEQQQRITLASQDTAPEPVAPPPPDSTPQAPVPHPAPQMAAAPAPAPTGNAYVDTFQAPPSKQATALWEDAGTRATALIATDQARFDGALQPLPVVLDGGEAKRAQGGGGDAHAPGQPPAGGAVPPAATPTPTPSPPPVTPAATAVSSITQVADEAQMKADASKAIDQLPTKSPDVKTDPGPAPVSGLAGQADPVRTVGDQQYAASEGAKALDAARAKIIAGPGAAQVQPIKLDEKLNVPEEEPAGAMPALPTVEGMAKFKQLNLPGNVQASFDEVARPRLDASQAQAQAQMAQADAKRDADRAKAVDDAHAKVKQTHVEADKQQQAKVSESRTKITNHQADTLVKQENEVKKLDQQSGEKKKATLGTINDRVARDQAKADSDYKAAQQKAEDQKKQGEAEAEQHKKEAEEQKQHESWWQKIIHAIADWIKSIVDALDKLFQAIARAVTKIIDEVKELACKLIDAVCQFVCQLLDEFASWLKSAITAILGSVFPQLAEALNRLIDEAVSAATDLVKGIADALKEAVKALCDVLQHALQTVISVFRAAVQIAAALAVTLVTGDWKQGARMVLEGVLKLLGVDPAAFYALIGNAEETIDKIVSDPGAFVRNLVGAVKQGFGQFGANFWTHLKDGVVQWLFGTFADAGIHMPPRFDAAGIFELVAQILGLTAPRMQGKVATVVGQGDPDQLDFVTKHIDALLTGGFAGLWEQIEHDLSGLWDAVIGGVKQWLIETVVQQAILKIATLWNPAGAIVQLIQTAWNVYQWVKENAQRIIGFLQAVVGSISNIAAGDIGGAANFIEGALARLVPIVISLFAHLLGIGGIADKIQRVIEKVRAMVDSAIDKLIRRVLQMFKGKDGKDKDGKDKDGKDKDGKDKLPIGKTISFVAAGDHVDQETHKTWIDVTGNRPRVMVASDPAEAREKLDRISRLLGRNPYQLGVYDDARNKLRLTEEASLRAFQGGGNPALEADLERKQQALAEAIKRVFDTYEGPAHNWMPFALDSKQARVNAPAVARTGGGFAMPAPWGPDRYDNAYIVNIAASLPHPAAHIGAVYRAGAFGPNGDEDLHNRFALVIGVNAAEDLQNTALQQITNYANAGVNQTYPWTIVGFTWEQDWTPRAGVPGASMNLVRQYFNQQSPEDQRQVLQYETANRSKPPMGAIRTTITQSQYTRDYYSFLSDVRARRVFIQVGDSDVVDLNPIPDKPPYFKRYDELLARMDADIAQHAHATGPAGPIIASGGYMLELKAVVGQLGADHAHTAIAAALDLKVRNAMARIDPGSVYFPEPNLIIQITPDTIRAGFGFEPAMESRRLVQNAVRALAPLRPRLLFDMDAAIVTATPGRMQIVDGGGMMRQWETIPPFTADQLRSLFNQSQSHATKFTWIRQINASYGLPGQASAALTAMYNACFPVETSDSRWYDPVGTLRSRLESWRFNAGALAAARGGLEGIVTEQRRKNSPVEGTTSGDRSGTGAEVAQRIASVAVEGGEAARGWLVQMLGRFGPVHS